MDPAVKVPDAAIDKPFRFMHFCITGVTEYNDAVEEQGGETDLLVSFNDLGIVKRKF